MIFCECKKCVEQRKRRQAMWYVVVGWAFYGAALLQVELAPYLVFMSFGIAANIVGTVIGFKVLWRKYRGK